MSEDPNKRGQTDAQIQAAPVEGSATAPIIFFEEVPACAVVGGVGRVQLVAYINDIGSDKFATTRKVAVAHLRGNIAAFVALKNAINSMELLATPIEGGQVN